MLWRFPVNFPNGLPTFEALQRQVSERSGLDVALRTWEDSEAKLTHPEFKRSCDLEKGPDCIALMVDSGGLSYLHYITLASLIDLGGQYGGKKLPDFVNIKWQDRKWWQFLPRS